MLAGRGDSGDGTTGAAADTSAGATDGTDAATADTSTGTSGDATATLDDCTTLPGETAGPYPADGSDTADGTTANVLIDSGIVRTDIRDSFGVSTAEAAGVPLELAPRVVDSSNACAPLAGRAVYAWHCDALGRYSVYDLPAENYLRGVDVTDENGLVTFTTIFPGCYAGRYPHIHFEVYPSLEARVELPQPHPRVADRAAERRVLGGLRGLGDVREQRG